MTDLNEFLNTTQRLYPTLDLRTDKSTTPDDSTYNVVTIYRDTNSLRFCFVIDDFDYQSSTFCSFDENEFVTDFNQMIVDLQSPNDDISELNVENTDLMTQLDTFVPFLNVIITSPFDS